MKRRVALITEIVAPYRVPVFNALAARDDIDLHVIFLSETDRSLRDWDVKLEEIRFPYTILPSFRRRVGKYNLLINRKVFSTLEELGADVLVCGGYNYLASWRAQKWALARNVPFLLWIESTAADQRQDRVLVEALKRRFIDRCSGFIVPGKSSANYVRQFDIEDSRIFHAPNAVDNTVFMNAAERARAEARTIRKTLGLPERYFLYVGRFVEAKGVFDLLEAYARLNDSERSKVGLVFAGDGSCRTELESRAATIARGTISFAGFIQKEQLAAYYALAEALVFPTHSDPWGLVVNEAMACSCPVIATDVAGCVTDLITDGWNGMVIPSHDVSRLTSAMKELAGNGPLRALMSQNSYQRIAAFAPERCAAGIAKAVAESAEKTH